MMKKVFALLLAVLLISGSMVTPVFAAGAGSIAVSPANPHPGNTVAVTYYVSDLGDVSSMAIEFNVPNGLTLVDAQWLITTGVGMQNVDLSAKRAVFAFSDNATNTDLTPKTAVFRITYQIAANQSPFTASVTVTFQAKKDGESRGTFTTTESIEVTEKCSHPEDQQEVRDAVKATCNKDGYTGDTWCKKCGVMLKQGVVEESTGKHTGGDEWKTDANNHWHICTTEGCNAQTDKGEHDFKWIVDKNPTEDATGTKHEECNICKLTRSEGTVIEKLDHTHTGITHHTAVAATCKATGTVEYWTCSSSRCSGKYYGDKNCTTELTTITTPIDKENHTGGTTVKNQKNATCGDAGYTGDKHCSGCDTLLEAGKEIPATGKHTGGTATCKEPAVCSSCSTPYGETNPENHTGGTEVKNAKDATCTEKGYSGDIHCKSCGVKTKSGSEIAAKGHTLGNWVTGNGKSYRSCANCDYTETKVSISTGDVTVEAPEGAGAEFEIEEVTNTADARYVLAAESLANDEAVDRKILNVLDITMEEMGSHIQPDGSVKVKLPVNWSKDVNYKVYYVDDNGNYFDMNASREGSHLVFVTDHFSLYVLVEEVPASQNPTEHTHTGGTATCKEKAVCTICGEAYGDKNPNNHTGGTEVKNAKAATCTEKGYTGDTHCKGCGAKTRSGSEIAAKGHTGGTATCTTKAVCTTCKQSYGNVDPRNHTGGTEVKNAKDATCTEKGYTGDTHCKGCGAKTKSGSDIAAKGHTGGTATCTTKAVCTICGEAYGEKNPNNHTGGSEVKNAKDATCTEKGYTGDTHCKGCGAKTKSGSEIAAKGHTVDSQWTTDATNHWHTCTTCQAVMDKAAHNFQWVTDKAPTEDAVGIKHEECQICKLKRNEGTVIEQLEHTHTGITRHAAVAATCVKEGNVEYWTCSSSKCAGKYYGDENCTTELKTITVAVNPQNHTGDTQLKNQKNATCCDEGYTGDTCCNSCGAVITAGQTIPATGKHVAGSKWYYDANNHWHVCSNSGCAEKVDVAGHAYIWVVDKEATETTPGVKHEECICGSKRNEGTEIPKLDHTHTGISHYAAVPATCVATGTVEYWTCAHADCAGKYYGDAGCQIELDTITAPIDKNHHTGKTEVRDAKAATCGEAGYSGDTYCTSCKGLVEKGNVIPATGKHTPKTGYEKDTDCHWQICSVCNAVIGGAKEAHTYTWIVDEAASEHATGLKHQECTVCGHKTNENTVIDKLPHNLEFVAAKPSTCTEDGVVEHFFCKGCGKYYASENGKAGEEISKTDVVIPATGHTFSEQWDSEETGHWHTCVCGEKSEIAEHDIEIVGAVEPTETEDGCTGDSVCRICGYLVAESEVIPAITPETTTATEPQETTPAQTEPDATEPEPSQGTAIRPSIIIVAVCIAVACAAVVAVVFLKKRKF